MRPEGRRHGVARALMQRLEAIAAEHGCGRFQWTVLRDNHAAIRFYESLGVAIQTDWLLIGLDRRKL